MDVANQLARVRLVLRRGFWGLGGRRGDGGFVVEAVEVTARLLEVFDPFLRLSSRYMCQWVFCELGGTGHYCHLCDHHVAVKGALAVGRRRTVDM